MLTAVWIPSPSFVTYISKIAVLTQRPQLAKNRVIAPENLNIISGVQPTNILFAWYIFTNYSLNNVYEP